jgi:hypothetical protein
MTTNTRLSPYVRDGLDVLFVALNAPVQSHANGHWFSGRNSRFYKLLEDCGLIAKGIPRESADCTVFGSNVSNFEHSCFGVVDLAHDIVETDSRKVQPRAEHVQRLLALMRMREPRFVCIIHSKVRRALNRSRELAKPLEYGLNGPVLPGCRTQFVLNYFPSGNAIPDDRKKQIFRELRERLRRRRSA